MKTKLLITIFLSLSVLFLQRAQADVYAKADDPVVQNGTSSEAAIQDRAKFSDEVNAEFNQKNYSVEDDRQGLSSHSGILTSVTPDPDFFQTPEPEVTAVQNDAAIVATNSDSDQLPTLEEFAAEVRAQGMQGIWADGLFAYRFYTASWGTVPGSWNTASYASYEGYSAFFIHNYLGGADLYAVDSGTNVAVIRADRIDWYQINGVHRFAGTSTGNGCDYTAPFYDWNGENSYSAMDLISTYYSSPFAIQTCICTGNKNGILILTGG